MKKHLTKEQRYTIKQGCSLTGIAKIIGKDKSVLSRELKRNCDKQSNKYDDDLAHRKYQQRQKDKPKHIRFTEEVKQLVDEWLKKDYSPEQIAGRAKIEGKTCVSSVFINMFGKIKKGGSLYKHLRRKGRKYRKRGNAKDTRGIIITLGKEVLMRI